jgi:hypothetical protein
MERTMPQQSVIFDERTDAKRVRVLKVYDAAYARSCFDEMNEDALAFLGKSLDLASEYDLPESHLALQWEDVEGEAREDGNLFSFFVVLEESASVSHPVFVSPDWPTAEEFARMSLGAGQGPSTN